MQQNAFVIKMSLPEWTRYFESIIEFLEGVSRQYGVANESFRHDFSFVTKLRIRNVDHDFIFVLNIQSYVRNVMLYAT